MDTEIVVVFTLLGGYLLDLLFGDPRWIPHPVIGFGKLIGFGDRLLNKSNFRILKGASMTLILTITVFLFFQYILMIISSWNIWISLLISIIFVFLALANKSLIHEGKEVISELEENGLEAGRKRLSWIVGRDTSELDENQIRTAVLETMAENLSDGVIAPLFWYAIGGIPAMMAFKMVSTMDSMIGYRNEKYEQYGKFAARLDDLLNFIPARLTALLMLVLFPSKRTFFSIKKYHKAHKSPNAAWPEAALAGILNCRFGGPNVYNGVWVDKAFIGNNPRMILHKDFTRTVWVNHTVCLLMVVLVAVCVFCV
ncbi:MAG: cobalamin biosynthesis protein CobD [Bacteroidales bacterium]|nr:cobalamin biosynthesis protein CobD [Bacteroidales bacterium]